MGTVPGMYHQASLNLTDVNVEARMDENGEMRILGIEATLEVRLVVYEEEKIIFAFILFHPSLLKPLKHLIIN